MLKLHSFFSQEGLKSTNLQEAMMIPPSPWPAGKVGEFIALIICTMYDNVPIIESINWI